MTLDELREELQAGDGARDVALYSDASGDVLPLLRVELPEEGPVLLHVEMTGAEREAAAAALAERENEQAADVEEPAGTAEPDAGG